MDRDAVIVLCDAVIVLGRVLDDFDDHFGRQNPPNVQFSTTNFADLGDDSNCKAKDDGPGRKFNSPVVCKHAIGGEKNSRRSRKSMLLLRWLPERNVLS